MSCPDVSQLKFYSHGRVAENKPTSTNDVLVVPVEILPLLDGDLGADDTELETTGVDEEGKSFTVKITTRMAIKCRWLQWGSNRHTAPDVRRDERVAIYRFADSDIFFWVAMGLDDHLRRLETVIYRWSNLPDGISDDKLDIDNCHVLEISAHKKLINLTTSDSNGEPFRYTLSFNLDVGCVTLTDNEENYIELDSADTKITIMNKDGTYLSADKRDLKAFAPNDFIFEAQNDMLFTVGNNFNITVGGDYQNDVVGNVTYTCTKWLTTAPGGFKVDAPNSEFTGNVKVGGALGVTGASTMSGSASFKAAASFQAPADFQAPITANGITSTATITGPRSSI